MEPKKEPSNTLIYVSNLPFETNDEQLRDLFKGFNLKTAYVAKKKNGKSKGFGFVNLEKESDQNAAIERVNGSEFNSRKLIAKVAMNDERRNEKGELKEEFRNQQNNQVASETVVYVSNLAWSVKDEDLKKIFSEYNPKVVTVATKRSGRSKGFGFVEFNNKEDREKALSLDQKSFHERTITVKPSTGYRGDRPRDRSRDNRRRNRSRNNRNRSRDNNRRSRDNNRNRSRNNRNRSRDNNRRSRENRNRSRDNNRSNNNNNNNNNNQQRTENKPKTENIVIGAEILTNPKQKKQNNKQTNTNNKTTNTKQNNNNQNKTNNNNQNKQKQTVNKQTQNTQTNNQSTSKPKTQNPQNKPKTQNPQTKTEKKPKTDSFSKVVSNRRTPNKTKKNTPTTENKSTNESSSNNNKNNNSNNRSNDRQREKRSEFTLYVKNLPFELDDKDLRDVFAEFHPKSSRIATTNSGRSKGYGFVEFNNENDQNNALRALDQSEINDRLVTVKLSSPNKERRRNRRSRSRSRSNRRSSNNNRQPSTTTVHVSNLEFSIDDKDLAGIFKELQISKAYVVKTQTGRSKGFGFVEFSNSEDQQKSLKRSGEEVKGRTIRVQASYVRDN